jgi:hypothetical protein
MWSRSKVLMGRRVRGSLVGLPRMVRSQRIRALPFLSLNAQRSLLKKQAQSLNANGAR